MSRFSCIESQVVLCVAIRFDTTKNYKSKKKQKKTKHKTISNEESSSSTLVITIWNEKKIEKSL